MEGTDGKWLIIKQKSFYSHGIRKLILVLNSAVFTYHSNENQQNLLQRSLLG
jgi:hypothetical protein